MEGAHVTRFREFATGVNVHLGNGDNITCAKLFLAGGTLSATRLVIASKGWFDRSFTPLSNPAFSFAGVFPNRKFAQQLAPEFGLSQLAFSLSSENNKPCFGMLYEALSMNVAEFALRAPFTLQGSQKNFLTYCHLR